MSHQWTMEDFESIYSRFKSSGLSVKEKSLLSAPPVSPSPIPQPLCEISYPNGVTVRLNSPLSPEVLQTLIFLNSNR